MGVSDYGEGSSILKDFILRRAFSFALALPALGLNYAVVFVLINWAHLSVLWVFSSVFIGDMVGFAFNSYLLDWQLSVFKRLKMFDKVMERKDP